MRNFFIGLFRVIFTLISLVMMAMFSGCTIIFLIAIAEISVITISTGVALVLLSTSCMSAIWFYLSLTMVNASIAAEDFKKLRDKQEATFERMRF